MKALLQDQPIVTQAYGKYKQFNQDERLRAIDEAHQRYLHDLATDIEEAREEGKIEGKLEGRTERDMEIALSMKLKGYSLGDIAEMTGLSYTEVERLN